MEELELVGERLHYKLREGTGPADGWVSLKLKEKPLVYWLGSTKRRHHIGICRLINGIWQLINGIARLTDGI